MKFYYSFQNFSKQSFFPFFIVGVPNLQLVSYKFESIIKHLFSLEIHGTVSPVKQVSIKISSNYLALLGSNSFENQLENLAPNKNQSELTGYDKNIVSSSTPAAHYKFSNFHAYSILLETFVKDFHVVSQSNLPYFQFFYFISQLEKDLDLDLHSFQSNLLNFCSSVYFVGFGENLLVNYSDFKIFMVFMASHVEAASKVIGSNSIFIFNFISNFISKIFNKALVI